MAFLEMTIPVALLGLLLCTGWGIGQQFEQVEDPAFPVDPVDPVEPVCPPSTTYNPVNRITINTGDCSNGTGSAEVAEEIKRELRGIKNLINTLQRSLENGEYGCNNNGPAPPPSPPPRDCYEILQSGKNTSGVYTISPDNTDPFEVYCDMDTAGGGWTVFQRREDGSVNFYLDWANYTEGFGDLEGEHWLGNVKLFYLTNQKSYVVRMDLADFEGESRFAVYDSFVITDASDNYRLTVGTYSGDAGDAMTEASGQQFSTRDQDHDTWSSNCAEAYKGGWWYNRCHYANLNGLYLSGPHSSYADGIEWHQWKGYNYSLKRSTMKVRPI